MSHIFDGVRWKIMRAARHSQLAEHIAQKFADSDFYRIAMQKDRKGRFIIRIIDAKTLPPQFGIIVGEAVHQLRACLDHMLWALAKPLPGKEGNVQFPLVNSRKKFKGTHGRMPGVPRGVRTLVESLQPYHRRKWPETALLGQLAVIDNWDKHRIVTTSVFAVEGTALNIINEAGAIIGHDTFHGVFKPGTIVARIMVSQAPQGSEVHIQPEFNIRPVFDDGMPKEVRGVRVIPFIKSAGEFIRETVIPMFEKFV